MGDLPTAQGESGRPLDGLVADAWSRGRRRVDLDQLSRLTSGEVDAARREDRGPDAGPRSVPDALGRQWVDVRWSWAALSELDAPALTGYVETDGRAHGPRRRPR